MAKKKKARLGRGLGALLGDVKATTQDAGEHSDTTNATGKTAKAAKTPDSSNAPVTGFREIAIEMLERGAYQPRIHMDKDALQELGASIKSQGVLQPLLVRPLSKDRFEIIAGERRWRGAQIAGLATVPAVVREISDQTAMAVGLIENIQRENLNAMEEARGYHRLLEEFGLTHQEISEVVGCSRPAVSNLLRLLTLHPQVQKMLEKELIDMGHARTLLALPEKQQPEAANQVQKKGFSVRQTEQMVRSMAKSSTNSPAKNRPDTEPDHSADIAHLEQDLSRRIGAEVMIQHGARKGKLVIHYHSLDELDGILQRIK